MLRIIRFSLLSLALLSTAVLQAAPGSWHDTNVSIIEQHVLPGYRKLASATAELDRQARGFCRSPSAAGLEKLRQDYHQAMNAWMGIQHIRLGPVEMFMRYHRYQLWPDKHNTGSRQMRQLFAKRDPQRLRPDKFIHTSVAVQGFTALERVLFGKQGKDIRTFGTADKPAYHCQLTMAISHNLAGMSEGLVKDWSSARTPFQKMFNTDDRSMVSAEGVDSISTSREVAARFLSQLHTQLEAIADMKLGYPLDDSLDRAKPRRAESWRSRRSMQNIVLNLQGSAEFYLAGFSKRVSQAQGGAKIDGLISQGFNRAITQARAIKTPLYEIVADPKQRPQLELLQQTIRELKGLISGNLSQVLELPQAFNSLDGD